MHYNFFADKADKLKILDFVFKDTDLHVYDLASTFDQEICEYRNVEEISSKFDFENGNKFANTFQLWTPRHRGKPIFRRINLDTKRCNGSTFRYSTDGWGLIQLYFGGLENNELNQSHIGHFSEKEALKQEDTNQINGLVNSWDWEEIQKTSRTIKNQIQSEMAIRRIGKLSVLKGADKLENLGIVLK